MKIILASASPRRRELMHIITDDFISVSTDADEALPEDISPSDAAGFLSAIKAEVAAAHYPHDIVIGCDTTVVCGGKILGKPSDKEQCRKFIRMLSGRTHLVITGCTLICGEKSSGFSVTSEVTFRDLTEEIEEYISTDEPYDKAGGYAVQGKGALLIDKINGDYFNIVGLPVSRLSTEIKKFINSLEQGD